MSEPKTPLAGAAGSAIHGFDGAWAHGLNRRSSTFSYGVFRLIRTSDGNGWKRGKVIVRVKGSVSYADAVKAEAARICAALDAGKYTGKKTVFVKPNATGSATAGAAGANPEEKR